MVDFAMKIDYFMLVYMYQLEQLLQTKENKMLKIKFNLDEANTDRPLKEFIRNVIQEECLSLSMDLIPENLELIKDKISTSFKIEELLNITINRVLLPDEITPEIKEALIKEKTALLKGRKTKYTNPDLLLEFKENDLTIYKSIELKSTDDDEIHGSSIQQVNPEEWAIFVQHKKKKGRESILITTGKYVYAINSKLSFPDRSPRPKVAFNELKNWNMHNRTVDSSTLTYNLNSQEYNSRCELISDWHQILCNEWMKAVTTFPSQSPKWFHKVLRKFILQFLTMYEQLSDEKKELLKKEIQNTILQENAIDTPDTTE